MKLYYSPGACSLSPHIALNEAGIPAERVKVDLKAKKTEAGEDYWAVNPNGYVPTLVLDDGNVLTEGPAIVQYIADRVPEKQLAPANGTLERYRLQAALNFISAELHKGFGVFFNPLAGEDWKQSARHQLGRRFKYVDSVLAQGPYFLGDKFTVADGYLFTIMRWAQPHGVDLSAMPRLGEYLNRVGSRPAVQAALKEEGLA
ncbi:MAG: Glutathione S-transferase [Rhodocyclaceae bacterium]|nr:Glutathione S-transferase [Rhodocyclaceae bacterium]